MNTGRIDVHSHLLPGVDDGCASVEESIACARILVANGYTHAFCTPHIWPNLRNITTKSVPQWTTNLQCAYADAGIALTLLPGGEMNLHAAVTQMTPEHLITMGMGGRYMLVDMWFDRLPDFFEPAIRWLAGMGLTVILAHPERMRAVQDDPSLADRFAEFGILLQGNLQCFSDAPEAHTRRVAEQYLREGRYFMLGSDSHNPAGMAGRMNGLRRAIELVGAEVIAKLTIEHPRMLLAD